MLFFWINFLVGKLMPTFKFFVIISITILFLNDKSKTFWHLKFHHLILFLVHHLENLVISILCHFDWKYLNNGILWGVCVIFNLLNNLICCWQIKYEISTMFETSLNYICSYIVVVYILFNRTNFKNYWLMKLLFLLIFLEIFYVVFV